MNNFDWLGFFMFTTGGFAGAFLWTLKEYFEMKNSYKGKSNVEEKLRDYIKDLEERLLKAGKQE